MRVTSIQLEMKDQPKANNIDYVLTMLDHAPESDVILLPEIWPCGFFSFDRYRAESEPLDGPLVNTVREKARERGCYLVMGSMVERDGDDLFNTSLFLGPQGEIIARYRKIHLFGYQSQEQKLLTPGKDIVVADTPWGPAGLSVCYDLRFPELFRKMIDKGAKFFLIISAWPHVRLEAWTLFNRARAHENLAYLFSCNCAGANNGSRYAGHSMMVDPLGKVIVEGGEEEGFVSAEVDMGLVNTVRDEFPALHDRVFR